MPANTVTDLIAPLEARAKLRAEYPAATDPTLVVEDARPLHAHPRHWTRPVVGRHRKPEEPLPGERPTGPIPRSQPIGARLPGEETTVLEAVPPLPVREPGTALAAIAVPAPRRRLAAFGLFLRGLVRGAR